MDILNWREHADNFFGNGMLVMAVVVGGTCFAVLVHALCRSDNPRDRHRPH